MIQINCIMDKQEYKHVLSLLADILKPFLQNKIAAESLSVPDDRKLTDKRQKKQHDG